MAQPHNVIEVPEANVYELLGRKELMIASMLALIERQRKMIGDLAVQVAELKQEVEEYRKSGN